MPLSQKLSNKITMAIEQSNDIILKQFNCNLKKEYSETIIQQDHRYCHYCSQILHRIRLRKYKPNTTLQDIHPERSAQANEIIIPQDGVYSFP